MGKRNIVRSPDFLAEILMGRGRIPLLSITVRQIVLLNLVYNSRA